MTHDEQQFLKDHRDVIRYLLLRLDRAEIDVDFDYRRYVNSLLNGSHNLIKRRGVSAKLKRG